VPFGGGGYEIRLAGRLSDSVLAAFECEAWGLTVSVEPAEMVLYGPVQDQAALCDLVDRFLSHGLGGGRGPAAPHIARRAWGEPEPPR
jgi:hypothetical protein